MSPGEQVTKKQIFFIWLPLAAMWLMMAIEYPVIAAVIARLPSPELNLASFGITFSLALIVESPIIMLLSAGTALPKGKLSYERLLHFTHILVIMLTAIHLLVGLTPLFDIIVRKIIGAPQMMIELSRRAFLFMTPWTGAIAYRRLWQGVLIRFYRTRVVPLTIAIRLVMSAAVMLAGFRMKILPGAQLAAVALSVGVIVAALAAYGFARSSIRKHLSETSLDDEPLTWSSLLEFYLPLAFSSIIVLVGRSILNMGLARAPQSLASLAVWPVITGFMFLGRSIALSYQETVISVIKEKASYNPLRAFTFILMLFLFLIFLFIDLTPLVRFWFERIAGLSTWMVDFAMAPIIIFASVPALSTLISWQRGLLIHVKRTATITQAVVLNVAMLITIMFAGGSLLPLSGATTAAIALASSILVEWLYLSLRCRPVVKQLKLDEKTISPSERE